MPDLGERIDLPSGQSLYYVDADHSYWRCKPDGKRGRRLTGVTTVIKPIDFEPDALMRWAAKENGKGIAMLTSAALMSDDIEEVRDQLSWLNSPESIWAELERNELTFNDLKGAKGDIGTAVHEYALGPLARGEGTPDYGSLDEDTAPYVQAMIDFWIDHDPEPKFIEQVVADTEGIGVAGRFDVFGRLTSECGYESCACHAHIGEDGVLDAKTSKWIYGSPHAQIAGYRYLAELSGIGETTWGALLHLRPDGTYELIEAQASAEDFLGAVGVYRSSGAIRSRVNAARKAASKREAVPA